MSDLDFLKFICKPNGLRAFGKAKLKILEFLLNSSKESKCTVSTAEIAKAVGRHYSTVFVHIKSLREDGFIAVRHHKVSHDMNGHNDYDLTVLTGMIRSYKEVANREVLTVPKLRPPPPMQLKKQLQDCAADRTDWREKFVKAEAEIIRLRGKVCELSSFTPTLSPEDRLLLQSQRRRVLDDLQPSRGSVKKFLLYEKYSPEEIREAMRSEVHSEIENGDIDLEGRDIGFYVEGQVESKKLRWEMISEEVMKWKKEWDKYNLEFCGGVSEDCPFKDLGW